MKKYAYSETMISQQIDRHHHISVALCRTDVDHLIADSFEANMVALDVLISSTDISLVPKLDASVCIWDAMKAINKLEDVNMKAIEDSQLQSLVDWSPAGLKASQHGLSTRRIPQRGRHVVTLIDRWCMSAVDGIDGDNGERDPPDGLTSLD